MLHAACCAQALGHSSIGQDHLIASPFSRRLARRPSARGVTTISITQSLTRWASKAHTYLQTYEPLPHGKPFASFPASREPYRVPAQNVSRHSGTGF